MKLSPVITLLASTSAAILETRQTPPADQITIVSAQTSGNGCPQGTVSTSFSTDKTVVTFGFDAFQTYIGPGTKPADKSKNCQIHLTLHYPGGFQYSLMTATYHGYARLDPTVTGSFLSTYYFSQDASRSASSKTTLTGPQYLSGAVYQKTDTVENASTIWSPCGAEGILNVNNRIALTTSGNDKNASGELSDDDATVAFEQKVAVKWRTCTK
ncbi:hypothetical protein EJ08DRAFT_714005 [Tothia fuscella]|uniref:Secreted protein n=1 Tax=Tothia fuscella TaxID=1048955 RepID=A0A9P4NSP2_9PEZI|nr:hypothetical protein EJ08DRAFT_714005 [Tothia fuscella]